MKKLFISQPMRGKTDEEILAVRSDAIQAAKDAVGEDVELIESFFQNAPAEARPLWFLGKSLELLATADIAYFAHGWEDQGAAAWSIPARLSTASRPSSRHNCHLLDPLPCVDGCDPSWQQHGRGNLTG